MTAPHSPQLSGAFHATLGDIVTNVRTARHFLSGALKPCDIGGKLTDFDSLALEQLRKTRGPRLLVMADMLTSRRRKRVVTLLPCTTHLLSARFEEHWVSYLDSASVRGAPLPAAEAVGFATWALERFEGGSRVADVLRHELACNDVAMRFHARGPAPAAIDIDALPSHCQLRLTPWTRIERFTWAMDEAMETFRRTGTMSDSRPSSPVCLVFYPTPHRREPVAVSKISPAIGAALERARDGIGLAGLLGGSSVDGGAEGRRVLGKLFAMKILEALA